MSRTRPRNNLLLLADIVIVFVTAMIGAPLVASVRSFTPAVLLVTFPLGIALYLRLGAGRGDEERTEDGEPTPGPETPATQGTSPYRDGEMAARPPRAHVDRYDKNSGTFVLMTSYVAPTAIGAMAEGNKPDGLITAVPLTMAWETTSTRQAELADARKAPSPRPLRYLPATFPSGTTFTDAVAWATEKGYTVAGVEEARTFGTSPLTRNVPVHTLFAAGSFIKPPERNHHWCALNHIGSPDMGRSDRWRLVTKELPTSNTVAPDGSRYYELGDGYGLLLVKDEPSGA